MPVVMGTAGHIDHGKTSLVRALTGIDCDRLSEEKKRGITIELGFAFYDMEDGGRLSIVDVPGHERFVKNMVAGAAGIDFVLLVVAADEGVMPQTREHLEICSLLGIDTGLVALTKTDMVDEEWLEMVTEDVADYLEGTFLAGAPIVPVSSTTGQGFDELKAEIGALLKEFKPKRRSDLARLPVDRVFTMKGYGTVVTGTLVSGTLGVGDEVELFPTDQKAKIRNLQSHGESVEKAPAGRRTAVNVQGLDVEDISRGDVLARPETLFPSKVWDVELTCLGSSPLPLKHRKEVHFHHGSKEVPARIYLLDRDKLMPGETAVVQARFETPMPGVYGDRVVLRSFSPLRTMAGGMLIGPMGQKVKRFSKQVENLASFSKLEPDELILAQVAMAGERGMRFSELLVSTNMQSKALDKAVNQLSGKQLMFCFDKERKVYAHGELGQTLSRSLLEHLGDFHKREPMKQGLSRGELASGWGKNLEPKLFHFILEKQIKAGEVVAEQEVLRLKGHKVSLASDEAKLRKELLAAYEGGHMTPPNLKDVLEPLGLTFKEAQPVYRLLMEENKLVKIKEDMYFSRPAVDEIIAGVVEFYKDHDDMGPKEFKGIAGHSRKFAIPLLEWLDKEKITVRVGDKRLLRKRQV